MFLFTKGKLTSVDAKTEQFLKHASEGVGRILIESVQEVTKQHLGSVVWLYAEQEIFTTQFWSSADQ